MKAKLIVLFIIISTYVTAQVTASKLIDIEAGILVRPMTTEFKYYNFISLLTPEDKFVNFQKNRTAPGIFLKVNFNIVKDRLFFCTKTNLRYGHIHYDYSKFDPANPNGILPNVNGLMIDNSFGFKYDFKTKIGTLSPEAGYTFLNKRGTEFDYYMKNQSGGGYTVYGSERLVDDRLYLGCTYQPVGRLTGSIYALYGWRQIGQYQGVATLLLELNLGYQIFK